MFTYLVLLAGAAVLLPAAFGFGRFWSYALVGFYCLTLGAVVVIATPTPKGYVSGGDSNRPVVSTRAGEVAGALLFSVGAFSLLGSLIVAPRSSAR